MGEGGGAIPCDPEKEEVGIDNGWEMCESAQFTLFLPRINTPHLSSIPQGEKF